MESMNFVYFTFFPLPSYRKPKKHFQEVQRPPDFISGTVWEIRRVRNMIPDISEYCIQASSTKMTQKSEKMLISQNIYPHKIKNYIL